MVKILSPITSFEAACQVIDGGVDEVYCGVEVPGINYTGLSTRPSWCSLPTYDELGRVVSYAHKHSVQVAVTTEFPFMAELIEKDIRRHIRACVEKGIDALIATDIGVILMVKNILHLNIPIYASTYLAPINYEVVDLLGQIGAKRVMLERHLTIDEIGEIVRHNKDIEIEAFVHGPGCSNINVNCYCCGSPIVLDPKFYKPEISVETLCQTDYEIYKVDGRDKTKIADLPILDAFSWCSLCQLPELLDTGIMGLKIVGRECDQKYQGEIARTYRELVDLLECGQTEDFKKKLESVKNSDYFSEACMKKRCYYSSLFHTPYRVPIPPKWSMDNNEDLNSH